MNDREPVVLRVDYDDADDLLADYADNLSHGEVCLANQRLLAEGAPVQLVLSFPGLVAPITIDGVVRWARAADEPTLGIALGPREKLAAVIERIRQRDPAVVKRAVQVVVVEDDPHVAELIRHSLGDAARAGLGQDRVATIRTACDGRAALAMMRDTPVDALIIDVYLPVVDGARLIATVRGELGLRALPIVAVSAGGDAARAAAVAAGADVFFDKPMRLYDVVRALRELLDRDPR